MRTNNFLQHMFCQQVQNGFHYLEKNDNLIFTLLKTIFTGIEFLYIYMKKDLHQIDLRSPFYPLSS